MKMVVFTETTVCFFVVVFVFCCRNHLVKLLEYCQTGAEQGATLVYGGKRVDRPGKGVKGRMTGLEIHCSIAILTQPLYIQFCQWSRNENDVLLLR